jgi:hypothetical protein
MSVPISYLITSFPIAVIILHGCWIKFSNSENSNDSFSIVYYIGKILMYVNTSTNIFLYICLGKSLRKDFVAISAFKFWKRLYWCSDARNTRNNEHSRNVLNQNALIEDSKHKRSSTNASNNLYH